MIYPLLRNFYQIRKQLKIWAAPPSHTSHLKTFLNRWVNCFLQFNQRVNEITNLPGCDHTEKSKDSKELICKRECCTIWKDHCSTAVWTNQACEWQKRLLQVQGILLLPWIANQRQPGRIWRELFWDVPIIHFGDLPPPPQNSTSIYIRNYLGSPCFCMSLHSHSGAGLQWKMKVLHVYNTQARSRKSRCDQFRKSNMNPFPQRIIMLGSTAQ